MRAAFPSFPLRTASGGPMRRICRNFLFCFVAVTLFALLAKGQDEPQSLGDVARKTREQKQQSKDTQDKAKSPAKKARVITDEEVAHSVADATPAASGENGSPTVASAEAAPSGKLPPDQWKSKILAQKNAVNTLQGNIDKVNESIQFAPGNCVSGCVQWNEHQKQKQADVERMQAELKDQQKRLDDMQEAARQQGYGSSVTDP
jgi:LAS superfamily LD-carboxypeptidase LdcB